MRVLLHGIPSVRKCFGEFLKFIHILVYKRIPCNYNGPAEKFDALGLSMINYSSLLIEASIEFFISSKMSYWRQYSNGMLTDQEARVLISVADAAADRPGE